MFVTPSGAAASTPTRTATEETLVAPSRIAVKGDLDLAAVPVVARFLSCVSIGPFVILDLTEVTFCSSGGWRCIEDFLDRARSQGTNVLVQPSVAIERLLSILDLIALQATWDSPSHLG